MGAYSDIARNCKVARRGGSPSTTTSPSLAFSSSQLYPSTRIRRLSALHVSRHLQQNGHRTYHRRACIRGAGRSLCTRELRVPALRETDSLSQGTGRYHSPVRRNGAPSESSQMPGSHSAHIAAC